MRWVRIGTPSANLIAGTLPPWCQKWWLCSVDWRCCAARKCRPANDSKILLMFRIFITARPIITCVYPECYVFSAFRILLVDIGTGCGFLWFLRLLHVALYYINGTRTHCCQYFIANTHNWTTTFTCNDIITHVQANNRIIHCNYNIINDRHLFILHASASVGLCT